MSTVEIWLVQYLCPNRHAIVAAPYERAERTQADIEREIVTFIEDGSLNPWCGLCGSRDLHFEHRRLPYTDWTTAMKALREVERAQMVTRAVIEASRESN